MGLFSRTVDENGMTTYLRATSPFPSALLSTHCTLPATPCHALGQATSTRMTLAPVLRVVYRNKRRQAHVEFMVFFGSPDTESPNLSIHLATRCSLRYSLYLFVSSVRNLFVPSSPTTIKKLFYRDEKPISSPFNILDQALLGSRNPMLRSLESSQVSKQSHASLPPCTMVGAF